MYEQSQSHSNPIWHIEYGESLKNIRSLSPTSVHQAVFGLFEQGQFFATIHAGGHRYVDFKPDNIGVLPFGKPIIIDPGGIYKSPIIAIEMINDFVVPYLHYPKELFYVFVKGYLYEAQIRIDPFHSSFTRDMMVLLGIELGNESETILPVISIFCKKFSDIQTIYFEDYREYSDSHIIPFLKLCNLRICVHPQRIPNIHDTIRSYLSIKGKEVELPNELSLSDICDLFETPNWLTSAIKKSPESSISIFSRLDGVPLSAEAIYPWSLNVSRLFELASRCSQYKSEMRSAMIQAFRLTLITFARFENIDSSTFIIFQTMLSSVSDERESLMVAENINRYNWHLFEVLSSQSNTSREKVKFSTVEESINQSILFQKLANTDYQFWVASVKNAGFGIFPAWAVARRLIEMSNKSLLVLFHGLCGLPNEQELPAFLIRAIQETLQCRQISFDELFECAKFHKCTDLLFSSEESMLKGLEWCNFLEKLLQTEKIKCQEFLTELSKQMTDFCFENILVDFPGGKIRHSQQDVFHGIGQTFKNGYDD